MENPSRQHRLPPSFVWELIVVSGNAVSLDAQAASRRSRFKYATGVYALAACWGGLQIAFPHFRALRMVMAISIASLVTLWAVFDARSKNRSIAHGLYVVYFLLWPIVVPLHLLAFSGWRGLLIALMHAVLLAFTVNGSKYATLYSLHFAGLLDDVFYQ